MRSYSSLTDEDDVYLRIGTSTSFAHYYPQPVRARNHATLVAIVAKTGHSGSVLRTEIMVRYFTLARMEVSGVLIACRMH